MLSLIDDPSSFDTVILVFSLVAGCPSPHLVSSCPSPRPRCLFATGNSTKDSPLHDEPKAVVIALADVFSHHFLFFLVFLSKSAHEGTLEHLLAPMQDGSPYEYRLWREKSFSKSARGQEKTKERGKSCRLSYPIFLSSFVAKSFHGGSRCIRMHARLSHRRGFRVGNVAQLIWIIGLGGKVTLQFVLSALLEQMNEKNYENRNSSMCRFSSSADRCSVRLLVSSFQTRIVADLGILTVLNPKPAEPSPVALLLRFSAYHLSTAVCCHLDLALAL